MLRRLPGALAILLLATAHADDFDVQGWIDEQVASGTVLAAAAMRLDDGEAEHFTGGTLAPGGADEASRDTQFEIGSITKAFTGLLLAEMVEQGRVSFDTTLGELVGDKLTFANPAVGDITLLQLATHSSGLPRLPANLAPSDQLDPYKGYDEEALLAGLAGSRDKQPLGKHYAYSNFGVGVLGYLLGRVHGGGYAAALEELIIRPLGLERTGFERHDESVTAWRNGQAVKDWTMDALSGAGALRSTITDLERLARIQLGELDNPLDHDLAGDLEVVGPAGAFDITRVWHVGACPDGSIYWHNGGTGGFWSFFGFRPATREAVAILVSGDPDPTGIGLRWLGFESPRPPQAEIDTSVLGQYELSARFGIGVYELNGVLVAQASGQTPNALHPVGDDWYAIDVADASVRFIREDDRVVALELAQNGVLQRAARTSGIATALARKTVTLSPSALAEYVGEYALNPSIKFTIRVGQHGLEAMLTGQPVFPIFAKGEDQFFYKVVDAELHFERDEQGSINALVLHQGGIEQRAEKTN